MCLLLSFNNYLFVARITKPETKEVSEKKLSLANLQSKREQAEKIVSEYKHKYKQKLSDAEKIRAVS